MSIPAQVIRQRDFSAGEINPDAERRDDAEMFKNGARYARNLQSLRTGQLERRSGRRWLYNDDGVRDSFRPFGEDEFSITFAANRLTVRNAAGAKVAELSAPWTDPFAITWDFYENRIFVCGDFRPQVITVSESGTWTIANYTFYVGLAGKQHAPFYRFAETKNITMRPSAITGSITVTFSAPVLKSGHVGSVFRYAGRQLRITGITNSTTGSATVLEKLNHTVDWDLTNANETETFSIGDIVSTSGSGVEAEVIAVDVPSTTVRGVITNRYRRRASEDRLVGPVSDADTDEMFIVSTPGATTQWDELFMSNVRGWPRSVSVDNQRVIFTDFPQHKSAIMWSAVGVPEDLLVTAEATGAILEFVQADCRVYHVVGGYDEFAITDAGVFYIPISAETPLAPGSVEFRKVFTGEVSSIRPVQVTEGLLFVDKSLTGVYAVTATGQTARPYLAQEISEFHRHLFSGIRSMAATAGTPQAATRQIYAVNDDGTLVIGQYNADKSYVGWLKWDGSGSVKHVASRRGAVVLSTVYPLDGGDIAVAEKVDPNMLLDCSVDAADGPFAFLENETVQVVADGFYFGNRTMNAEGELEGFDDYDEVMIGFLFEWKLQPNLGAFEGGEAFGQRLRRRKISKVMIKVRETTEFRCGDPSSNSYRLFAGYEAGDDTNLPMPIRSDVYQYRQLGRSYDPTYELAQTIPGPFRLQELTTEITV